MTVIVLEKVTPGLRGWLSRWMIEPKSGVFVGKVSRLVREKLWEMIQEKMGEKGAAVMIWSTNNEQGFDIEMIGERKRQVVDFDGLKLIKVLKKTRFTDREHEIY